MPVAEARQQQVQELTSSVPAQIFEVSQDIVDEAQRMLGTDLSKDIYLILADHLNFAIERMRQGIRITNKVFWEIKNYYPDEFRAGLAGIALVQSRLGIELPEEEAANLAFHFANARADQSGYDSMRYAKVMGSLVSLVTLSLNKTIDTKSIHYLRFLTHIKYFVERYFSGQQLHDQNSELYAQLAKTYPREDQIAHKVQDYMESHYGQPVEPDEIVYLLVHIARLSNA